MQPALSRSGPFSAALCRGLIEATCTLMPAKPSSASFPRLYAAASLKHARQAHSRRAAGRFSAALCRGLIEAWPALRRYGRHAPFSAALCRGLIEAWYLDDFTILRNLFSAALCRGLIEANRSVVNTVPTLDSFPRLYAAASLKLVEGEPSATQWVGFPRLYAAASLKRRRRQPRLHQRAGVFRGLMPRPH